ncbi:type IV pilus secretin PilQ family protein [Endozoicomonas gorgoniicola]|uniref:Type IV pilus secretin PilQ family protein n=1 Tax=Endozoicomonas gorgoniicola TaxID=1234144 RepID=A0ABT3N3W1_9GAMM|nr:type IV pilus secretin PilQ family protein [Endozoicomonas gorgoniicola]MCW7556315.1 type IV pilus secretin PilQ family protein [Endozoicomonas gorgoniicola]
MNTKPVVQTSAAILLFVLLAWMPTSIWAVTLKKMDAGSLPGGMVELKLMFDGPAPQAKGYSVDQPPRISIDLPYTRSSLAKYNEIGFDNAQSVTVLESGDRTRLVVNLRNPTSFSTKSDGNTLYVYLGSDSQQRSYSNDQGLSPMVAESGAPMAEPGGRGITHIDFQRGEEGEGNVVITLANADIPMDMNEMAGRIRLEFQGNVLPGRLRNRLDVMDFATPVKYIDAKTEDGNAVVIIEPKGEFDYLAYQADNIVTVSVKPAAQKNYNRGRRGLSYKGDKLSLNFQDIKVREVLQLIADFTDLNLVASDTVTGNVTLRLQNVPWDQALDIVLKAKGLDKRQEGNVLTVAPAEEIAARERQQLENDKQIRELAPVYTDLIQINYADASEISDVLSGTGDDTGLLTDRGSVQVVARTNSLLVKDTQEKLDEIRALITRLDIPVRQVMIEARIVNINSNYSRELGVKWSGGKDLTAGQSNRAIGIGGNGTNAGLGSGDSDPSSGVGDKAFVDFGLTGTNATSLAIGFATNSTILNLELSAILSDGGGEAVSQPKVITADKTMAVIKAGKEIPYEEKTSSGATSVAFKDAVLSLEVTPQITPEGSIIMDVKVTNDSEGDPAPNGVPTINKNEVNTQVLVKDGATVVLGGVFTQSKTNTTAKVPLLGDIPYVGALFRKKTNKDTNAELMIFITPRIINENVALR